VEAFEGINLLPQIHTRLLIPIGIQKILGRGLYKCLSRKGLGYEFINKFTGQVLRFTWDIFVDALTTTTDCIRSNNIPFLLNWTNCYFIVSKISLCFGVRNVTRLREDAPHDTTSAAQRSSGVRIH